MDAETLWKLFWATGLPEAAALAGWLQRAEEACAREDKTA